MFFYILYVFFVSPYFYPCVAFTHHTTGRPYMKACLYYVFMHVRVGLHLYVCNYVCMNVAYVYLCVCIYACMNPCTHIIIVCKYGYSDISPRTFPPRTFPPG